MTCKWKVFCEQGDTCVAHVGYDVLKCTAFKEKGTLTNEEWLKQCNTEQLAEVLMKIFSTRTFCHLCPEGDVCDIGYKCKYSEGKKIDDWKLWLKQPHTTIKE